MWYVVELQTTQSRQRQMCMRVRFFKDPFSTEQLRIDPLLCSKFWRQPTRTERVMFFQDPFSADQLKIDPLFCGKFWTPSTRTELVLFFQDPFSAVYLKIDTLFCGKFWTPSTRTEQVLFFHDPFLSLLHICEPTIRYSISYEILCLKKKLYLLIRLLIDTNILHRILSSTHFRNTDNIHVVARECL